MTKQFFAFLLFLFSSSMMMGTALADDPFTGEKIDNELSQVLSKAVNDEVFKFKHKFDAEVWLLSMSTRLKPFIQNKKEQVALLKTVHLEALNADLKPEIVLALIQVESNFDRYAVSHVGAQGMMQVMPFWKKEIGRPDDNLTLTKTNLRYGCTILKYYLDKEDGNLRAALARYNGSSGKNWYPDRVFKAYKKNWLGGELSAL